MRGWHYDTAITALGQNFLSTKQSLLHPKILPRFLCLNLLTSALNLKEINYWYVLLFTAQSPGLKIDLLGRKPHKNIRIIGRKKKTLLCSTPSKFNYLTILKILEKQFLFLKNPAHKKISRFSEQGELLSTLYYCETYNVHKTRNIQKQTNFYISDISLLASLKIYPAYYNSYSYLLCFWAVNQNLNTSRPKLTILKKKLITTRAHLHANL